MVLVNLLDRSSPEWKTVANKAASRKRSAAYRLANPEKSRETVRRCMQQSGLRYHLDQHYGITEYQRDYMFVMQSGKCAGCGCALVLYSDGEKANVDHDHATNSVRGLLCKICNLVLGNVNDSPQTLRNLATYLERGPFVFV